MASKKNVKAVPEQKEQVRMASVQESSGDGKGTESERAAAEAQADGRGQRRAGPRGERGDAPAPRVPARAPGPV